MISMKIEKSDKKIIVYLYRYKLSFSNLEKLNEEIKNLFIKLIKVYHMNFFGYSKVDVYENKRYGSVLEIEKIYNNEFNIDIIDLKLIIHEDIPFYLEMDDYLFDIKPNDLYVLNNKFYINIEKLPNIMDYIEYGKIIYNLKNKID